MSLLIERPESVWGVIINVLLCVFYTVGIVFVVINGVIPTIQYLLEGAAYVLLGIFTTGLVLLIYCFLGMTLLFFGVTLLVLAPILGLLVIFKL